jgi:predicted RNase H-like nuclease (RuvC/YqgF family)
MQRGNLLRGEARFIDAPSSKERVKQYRLRQKELGRLKREMYLTETEFEQLKTKLAELRKSA